MAPYWLLLDIHDLAKFAAFTFFAGCAWVAFVGREFATHHSTVDPSASAASPAAAGVGRRAVGSTLYRPEGDQSEGFPESRTEPAAVGAVDSPTP